MYIVLKDFTDLQDKNTLYCKDDFYPSLGKTVSLERIEELSSSDNKRGEALIKKVELAELNIEQLCKYAVYNKVEVKEVILSKIEEEQKLCELIELRNKAKKYKIKYTEETTLDDLKKFIETYEKEKK